MNEVQWRFPPASRSVPEARRRVSATLADWGLDGLADTVVLLVSEIVTNAVLHARTDLTVSVSEEGTGVRVSVADGSPLPPALRRHSATSTTGRGIQLLDMLADSWHAESSAQGKVVWFTVTSERDPWAAFAGSVEAER